MTQTIADRLGPTAVPHLVALLGDASFPRPDNVVAYLTYLARDASHVRTLREFATSRVAARASQAQGVGGVAGATPEMVSRALYCT
jgi:hypothetical protein